MRVFVLFLLLLPSLARPTFCHGHDLSLVGQSVTPHVVSEMMQYRRARSRELGARVQLFVQNRGREEQRLAEDFGLTFDRMTADELVVSNNWAWHDTPSAWPEESMALPASTLTVWQFNTTQSSWGAGTRHELSLAGHKETFELKAPEAWVSAVTFLGERVHPERVVIHVANERDFALCLKRVRLWLPEANASWRVFHALPWCGEFVCFPASRRIPAKDRGGLILETPPLPLTYGVLQVDIQDEAGVVQSLWTHLRIKREVFDISGGWVASDVHGRNTLTLEPYLKTLKRMHINTAHIAEVSGYTNNPALYDRYPLKLFNRLQPLHHYDTDAMLPRIHAVEFLGEPQYGGGRPVPPMEVWQELKPYQSSRLATTVTHSEERIWRDYAGLSDYPHFDAYRITAPAADSWSRYDRWGDARIRWGAPLETIGEMTRNLRELNRPVPVAYWSQGAHHGWGRYGGRTRTSPTPHELRSQALHALAARITSLYWFNLSLKSLAKFPDLIEPITRVGREIGMLDDLLLEGDAYAFKRQRRAGRPDWELASIIGPRGGVFFALDTGYQADLQAKAFVFGPPRAAVFRFQLPAYLARPAEVFRVDAEGVHACTFQVEDHSLVVSGRVAVAGIYVASAGVGLREAIAQRHRELLEEETALGFDPGNSPGDLQVLQGLLGGD